MKQLKWIVILSVSLLANNAEVQYNSLTLKIDGKNVTHAKNSKFTLPYSTNICLVKGDGLLIITNTTGDQKEFTRMGLSEDVCFVLSKPQPKKVKKDNRPWYEKVAQGVKGFFNQDSKDIKNNGISKKDYEK